MKPGLTGMLALTLLQVPSTRNAILTPSHFRFTRQVVSQGIGESCAVLDASVLSHAAPSLKDLRLFSSIGPIPYTIILSETAELTADAASLVQIHAQPASIAFVLEMPPRPYTEVDLDLRQQDFVVKATVSGMNDKSTSTRTPLGTFTLFDLTSRHLSRNTTLPLQESAFRYLHVNLSGDRLLPESIHGAQVPPSREAQTLYTPVAASSSTRQKGSATIASFQIPAHVPVERVAIELSPRYTGNFSRKVRVTGRAAAPGDPVETIDGTISSVHLGKAQSRQTAFPAVMGVNLQQNATIEVAIENGKDKPLPVSSVRLEMRRRSICFEAPPVPLNLLYGNPSLSAPSFALNAPVSSHQPPLSAVLGPETRNPAFQETKDVRTLSDRRPDLIWFLLLAGVGMGGVLSLHTLRRR